MQTLYRVGAAGIIMLLLNACSTAPYQTSTSPAEIEDRSTTDASTPAQVETAPATSTAVPGTKVIVSEPAAISTAPVVERKPAVIALLDSASKQQQQGDYHAAQSTLQRAQRIAPRDPQVYYSLAQTHLELESYALAEQVALKGVSLVQGQAQQLKRFWQLIARIRLQAGNPQGAEQAEATAAKY